MAEKAGLYGMLVALTNHKETRLFISDRENVVDALNENLIMHTEDYINGLEKYDQMISDVVKYLEVFVKHYHMVTLHPEDIIEHNIMPNRVAKRDPDTGNQLKDEFGDFVYENKDKTISLVDGEKLVKVYGANNLSEYDPTDNTVIVAHHTIKL